MGSIAPPASGFPTPLTTKVQNPRLKLLNGLRDGKYPLMTFMAISSVRMAQIVALTGFDGAWRQNNLIRQRLSIDRLTRYHHRC